MNPFDRAKEAGMARAMQAMDVRDHPLLNAIATIIAGLENEQALAVARCMKAAEMDGQVKYDVDARREELLDIAKAISEQDFERYWFEERVDSLEKPERAREYVGLEGEEWREQMERWYESYRKMGAVEQPVDAVDRAEIGHIAAMHVETSFGVSLREFVAGVVSWDRREALKRLLAGNIQAYTAVMHQVAEEIEHREQRIEDLQEERDRLQQRVDELEEDLQDDVDDTESDE